MRQSVKNKLWNRAINATKDYEKRIRLAYKEVREVSEETINEKVDIQVKEARKAVYRELKETREAKIAGGAVLGMYALAIGGFVGWSIWDDKQMEKAQKEREAQRQAMKFEEDTDSEQE